MKAKDWKFDKHFPDAEDIEAGIQAAEAYFDLAGTHTDEVSCFASGFNRGIAWHIAKLSDEENQEDKV